MPVGAVLERHFQHPEILPGGEKRLALRFDPGRDDDLGKLFSDGLRGGAVERAVECENTAEGRDRIGLERFFIGREQVLADGGAAGIGMLDDDARRLGKALHALPGRVRIRDVVVRQFLALHLPIVRQASRGRRIVAVKRRRLVRVLAVAHVLYFSELKAQDVWKLAALRLRVERKKIVGDGAVVGRGVREHFLRQREARRVRERSGGANLLQHRAVIGRIDHHRAALMILCRRAQHGRTADVDVLDRILEPAVGIGDRGRKRVEIDHDQVDRRDARVPDRGQVLRAVPARKDPAVDLRMQRLDPAVGHFGKACIRRNLGYADAFPFQQLRRAAGREERDAEGGELARKLDDSRLVRDTDQRLPDGRHLIRCCRIFLRSVLRSMPSMVAASVWLPSDLPSTISIMGFSTLRRTMS